MKTHIQLVMFVLGMWVASIALIIRLFHPELIDVQLFIEFFPIWIVAVVGIITIFILVDY